MHLLPVPRFVPTPHIYTQCSHQAACQSLSGCFLVVWGSLVDSSNPDGFPDFLHVPDGLWSWYLSISFPERKSWDHSIFYCIFLKCCSICTKCCYENVWCLSDFHSFINDLVFLDGLSRGIFYSLEFHSFTRFYLSVYILHTISCWFSRCTRRFSTRQV